MSERLVDLMEQAFSSVDELYSSLEPAEWRLPTDLPGWDVGDQLAHVAGIESWLLGRPRATPPAQKPDHVRNPLGEVNEAEVIARRGHTPEQMLEEWRELTGERLKALAALTPEEWEAPTDTPIGPGTVADLIATRILDVHYHEQDARRATGRGGHLNGDVARHVFDRMARGLPMIVGKRAAAPEGSTVVFDVAPPARSVAVGVEAGRGRFLDAPPDEPTARLAMDLETFLCLCGGRWTAERALGEGRVSVSGDRALAEKVLAGMNIMV